MNDNKKWYKKLTTVFWWILACLPIIVGLGTWIFWMSAYCGTGTPFTVENVWSNSVFYSINAIFYTLRWADLYLFFQNMFRSIFGFTNMSNQANGFVLILTWFIQIHFLHLIVDCILMLPKVAQKLIEKVGD